MCNPLDGRPYVSRVAGPLSQLSVSETGTIYSVLLANYAGDRYFGPDGLRHLFLPIEGKYYFRAKLMINGAPTIESNEVIIDAVQPQGADAKAFEIWRDPICATLVQDLSMQMIGHSAFDEGFIKLRTLIAEFPDSAYTSYAKVRMAKEDAAKSESVSHANAVDTKASVAETPSVSAPATIHSEIKERPGARLVLYSACLLLALGVVFFVRSRLKK